MKVFEGLFRLSVKYVEVNCEGYMFMGMRKGLNDFTTHVTNY